MKVLEKVNYCRKLLGAEGQTQDHTFGVKRLEIREAITAQLETSNWSLLPSATNSHWDGKCQFSSHRASTASPKPHPAPTCNQGQPVLLKGRDPMHGPAPVSTENPISCHSLEITKYWRKWLLAALVDSAVADTDVRAVTITACHW